MPRPQTQRLSERVILVVVIVLIVLVLVLVALVGRLNVLVVAAVVMVVLLRIYLGFTLGLLPGGGLPWVYFFFGGFTLGLLWVYPRGGFGVNLGFTPGGGCVHPLTRILPRKRYVESRMQGDCCPLRGLP